MVENNSDSSDALPRIAPTKEAIAERAYELWEQQGCRHGKHTENWDEAERELAGRANSERQVIPPVAKP